MAIPSVSHALLALLLLCAASSAMTYTCPDKCTDPAMAAAKCTSLQAVSNCMVTTQGCERDQASCKMLSDIDMSPPSATPSSSPQGEKTYPPVAELSPTPSETPLPSESSTPKPSVSGTPMPSESSSPMPSASGTPMPSESSTPKPMTYPMSSRSPSPSPTRSAPSLSDSTAAYRLLFTTQGQMLGCTAGTMATTSLGTSCDVLKATYSLYVGTAAALAEQAGCFATPFAGVSCLRLCSNSAAAADEMSLYIVVDVRGAGMSGYECATGLAGKIGRDVNAFSSNDITCFTRDFDRNYGGAFITTELTNAMMAIVMDTLCERVRV